MAKLNVKGFSMIELLVVLLIIAVLAAVAAPLFLSNTSKAKLSEAVAGAGSIRSGERTYYSQYGSWLAVTSSETLYFGTNGASSSLLGVTIHGNKYFSPICYSVALVSAGATWSSTPSGVNNPLDFVITVNGTNSISLATDTTDGAASNSDVNNYVLEMDNAGQIIYSTTGIGGTWSKY